jgi:anti-anti-sigma factor
MSQCHDPSDLTATVPMPPHVLTGDQCHDEYPWDEGADAPKHECGLVDELDGGIRVLHVTGRLDWASERKFLDYMCDDCADSSVIIDLSDAVLDSAGTGALVATATRARQRGQRLALVVPDAVELEVLRRLGVDDLLPLVASESEAVAWFVARPTPAGAR